MQTNCNSWKMHFICLISFQSPGTLLLPLTMSCVPMVYIWGCTHVKSICHPWPWKKNQELSTQKRKKLLSTIRATKKWTCLKLAQEYTVPPHCEVDSKGREKRFRFSFINSCICQVLKSPVKHHLHNKLFGSAAWKKPFLSTCHKMQLSQISVKNDHLALQIWTLLKFCGLNWRGKSKCTKQKNTKEWTNILYKCLQPDFRFRFTVTSQFTQLLRKV